MTPRVLRRVLDWPRSVAGLLAKPYSQFHIVSDSAGWILDEEAKELALIAQRLGIPVSRISTLWSRVPQCVHYTSQFVMKNSGLFQTSHRISLDYFHGLPQHDPVFADCFEGLRKIHDRITKLRVSHSQIHELVLTSGIHPSKVHRIPIGINLSYFQAQTPTSKSRVRSELGIPPQAIVIGSFQKDGTGWGDGLEPKRIKGPDVFLKTVGLLKERLPEVWVLLSGPSRGFVKKGLDEMKVPYVHRFLKDPRTMGELYQALDFYIVASRDEGGPKAILESMASGIPLVTTHVGQARDLVTHKKNAWMVESEDIEGLAKGAQEIVQNQSLRQAMIKEGFVTAAANSYEAQIDLWRAFFKDYVAG